MEGPVSFRHSSSTALVRLKRSLRDEGCCRSIRSAQDAIADGRVEVNGSVCRNPSAWLYPGDEVRVAAGGRGGGKEGSCPSGTEREKEQASLEKALAGISFCYADGDGGSDGGVPALPEAHDKSGMPRIAVLHRSVTHAVVKASRGVGPMKIAEIAEALGEELFRGSDAEVEALSEGLPRGWDSDGRSLGGDMFPGSNVENCPSSPNVFPQCIRPVMGSPHYKAYATGLVLVCRNSRVRRDLINGVRVVVRCLVKGVPSDGHLFEDANMTIRILRMCQSNSAGQISLVECVISNISIDPSATQKWEKHQLRRAMCRAGFPVLGNTDDAQAFRGEPLALSVVRLDFSVEGHEETYTAEQSVRLEMLMDKEERFYRQQDRIEGRTCQPLPPEYVSGHTMFCGLDLAVNKHVMVPRDGTEAVVKAVISALSVGPKHTETEKSTRVLDLGTGSGCILLAVLGAIPFVRGVGVDVSKDALEVATANATRVGSDIKQRSSFTLGTFVKPNVHGQFDLIVSNPPYHTTRAGQRQYLDATTDSEPELALYVEGNDRLLHYRHIMFTATQLLRPGGVLVLEVFRGNAGAVAELMQSTGFGDVRIGRDSRGNVRLVEGRATDIG